MSQHTPNRRPETSLEWAAWAAYLADSKKATDIQILHTEKVSQLADYFIICSGQSKTQVRAIAEEIAYEFKHVDNAPSSDERDVANTWCLLDFKDIVIHVMEQETRRFYQLEQFWSHADLLPDAEWHDVAKDLGLIDLEV